MTLKLAETSVVKGRPSVPHGANYCVSPTLLKLAVMESVITHADRHLSVYLHDISKTAAARVSKLQIEMFHRESWKPIYFGVKRSKVKVVRSFFAGRGPAYSEPQC